MGTSAITVNMHWTEKNAGRSLHFAGFQLTTSTNEVDVDWSRSAKPKYFLRKNNYLIPRRCCHLCFRRAFLNEMSQLLGFSAIFDVFLNTSNY